MPFIWWKWSFWDYTRCWCEPVAVSGYRCVLHRCKLSDITHINSYWFLLMEEYQYKDFFLFLTKWCIHRIRVKLSANLLHNNSNKLHFGQLSLTHLLNILSPIQSGRQFPKRHLQINVLIKFRFESNFIEVFSCPSNPQQAIIWTNDGLVYWRIYSWLGLDVLTHWGRDEMAANFQTSFSNAFSWMKLCEFWLNFHLNLFLRVQL